MSREPTVVELIESKRDGHELSAAEIAALVRSYVGGDVPDYQMSAWLMAAFLRGLSFDETVALTDSMARSGRLIRLDHLPGPVVDKHSTGGVSDATTLVVAPLAAACGLYVAKMSGHGLGHTGGTLDKLESIPGFRAELTPEEFETQLADVGLAVIAQSPDVDPADKAIYALRDVTGTVPSIPLIVSSVVSKKVAGGARVIVVDVKCGSGAFMKTIEQAMVLARAISDTGAELGRSISCLVTDMDSPLGMAVGNALEVAEAVSVLRCETRGPLADLSVELVARLVMGAGVAPGIDSARATARARLEDGSALARFVAWITAQGGDGARLAEEPADVLPASLVSREVLASVDGFVAHYDAESVGRVAVALGAGRVTKGSAVDPAAGLLLHKRVGEAVVAGEQLATLFAARQSLLEDGEERFLGAVGISPVPPVPPALVLAEVPAPDLVAADPARMRQAGERSP